MALFDHVNSLTEQPVTYDESYIKGRGSIRGNVEAVNLESMILKPKANNKQRLIIFRVLSILFTIFSLVVLIT